MKIERSIPTRWIAIGLLLFSCAAIAADKPNIILINMDNFGYGELGVYGGGITPTGFGRRYHSPENDC